MGVFIKLTALKRNDLPFTKEILVDVNKIVTPIIENELGESIIEVDTNYTYIDSNFPMKEKYVVSEDLDAIDALTDEVFKGTINTVNGRSPLYPEALFVKSRVVGTVKDIAGGEESEFDYKILSANSPETYVVNESVDIINL
jgi:hypothetical protein